jgi:glutamate racemase
MPDMESTDKKFIARKIGVFDSGIGGFSVLGELFKAMPAASYFYISDEAFAPYGPKSDELITERCLSITRELLLQGVELIVVACNTATAASIDTLRLKFNNIPFVGVEPYLNAYYKMPEGPTSAEKKMMVLTTESTGKSERFKRLKERLDPDSQIDHYSLKNMARLIENYYYHSENSEEFKKDFEAELEPLKAHHYAYAILGCTHYPLVRKQIEDYLHVKTISPDAHVAQRVLSLCTPIHQEEGNENFFQYLSTTNNQWIKKERESLYGPFKNGSIKQNKKD